MSAGPARHIATEMYVVGVRFAVPQSSDLFTAFTRELLVFLFRIRSLASKVALFSVWLFTRCGNESREGQNLAHMPWVFDRAT